MTVRRTLAVQVLLVALVSALLLLAACSASVRPAVDADARVASFLQLFPGATYSEMAYGGASVDAIRDVVAQDCVNVTLPGSFTRAAYVTKAATLVAYVDGNGTVFCVASKLNPDAFAVQKGDPSMVSNGTLVTVNGEPITLDDVRAVAAQLPPDVQNQTTVASLVNTLIDQRLLRQAAANTSVSESDVTAAAESAWKSAGYADEASFGQALAAQGSSYAAFLNATRDRLKVQRFLQARGVTDVNVSEDAARRYYLDNPNSFLVSEQVRFRQIFFSFNATGGEQGAQRRLQAALAAIGNGTDFCAAVRQYSDDTTSRERCGEYVTPRGVLSPDLEAAVFSLGINRSTVVQSANGFHLLVVLAHQPTAVIPFSQAEQQVVGLLRNAAVQQRLDLFLLKLRADATVVDYTR